MKTILYIFLSTILAGGAYIAYETAPYRPVHREVYMLDKTDSFRINPTIESIEREFSWSKNKQERQIRLLSVSDVVLTDIATHSLSGYRILNKPETWAFDKYDGDREQEIRRFEEAVKHTIDSMSNTHTGYRHTAFVESLVAELILLQQYPDDDRVLYYFGDCGEHSIGNDWIRDTTTIRQIKEGDPTPWNKIEGVDQLHDLSDIHINFIFRGDSAEADEGFRTRSKYLKHHLETLHAEVTVRGSIKRMNVK